ncbi:MAG: hypothetical protein UR69_C0001G0063 [Candidatus Moranbacteria bacterium GW2011_GWE2_35_2-]|nr:MAG: hypothetical protein UR69_C0001G0063 [Candidatus Moranbacteria bacterium GW2011_GWE2_35_2-]KKQ05818.1 MAG: hypothetical protein US15_C0025G0005 [Candidatus Moranbacteria bacterium GW2011_GWF1_36_4]KKQ22939.1 MAG: hypothetical protein US37_C0001G0211 [Candidatus Moranbacteria bacterium GW2011_GWF2_37_11]KKQ29297.1 MAG: hypothetical protein US44_C0002G0079 [Candidatus Moranbacteria bacterium GW2011_GWD1_37_17]KKQ30830.1 MAG: hypothetical protein US47_C0001G0063 [Candidatus Moranbacteria b
MKKFLSTVAVVAIFAFSASVASACGGYSYVGGDVSSSLYGGVSGGALQVDSYYGGSIYAYTPTGTVYAGMSVQNSIGANAGYRGSVDVSTSGGAGFFDNGGAGISTWSGVSANVVASNGSAAWGSTQANVWAEKYGSVATVAR